MTREQVIALTFVVFLVVAFIVMTIVGIRSEMKAKQKEKEQCWSMVRENTELKAEVQRLKLEIEIRDKYEEVPVLTEGK
jgi:preprotein translocase subunit YajC